MELVKRQANVGEFVLLKPTPGLGTDLMRQCNGMLFKVIGRKEETKSSDVLLQLPYNASVKMWVRPSEFMVLQSGPECAAELELQMVIGKMERHLRKYEKEINMANETLDKLRREVVDFREVKNEHQ